MKKSICAVLAASLSLLGCSSSQGTEPTSQTTQESAKLTTDVIYLQLLRSKFPVFNSVSDATLIGTGREVCDNLDKGMSLSSIMYAGMSSPLGADAWGYQVGVAIASYCPQHTDQARQLVQRYGG